jgi:hypothetical protein
LRLSPPTFALGALLAATSTGCEETSVRTPCSPNEVRIAERCVPVGDTSDFPSGDALADAIEDTTSVDTVSPTDTVDMTSDTDAPPTLPFFIDTRYIMSGYMGSGDVQTAPCEAATPSDSAAGACLAITWTPATGTTSDWTGFFFQYPENNWGDAPGFPIPAGATAVTFRAWGARGDESANFAVGIRDADGFQLETGYLALTAAPKTYSIPLTDIAYTDIAGAFAWFLDNPTSASEISFFLDDIAWTSAAAPCAGNACKTDVTFEVDMNCPDPATPFDTVWVTGPFCSWCAEGFELTDSDGDGRYSGTFPMARGPLEFKFMTNGFASQEDLLDDLPSPTPCVAVTDGSTYANRRVTVLDAPLTVQATYGSCGVCP